MPDPTTYDPGWGGMDPEAGIADLLELGRAVDSAKLALSQEAADRVLTIGAANAESQRSLYAKAVPLSDKLEDNVRKAKVSLYADTIARVGELGNTVAGAKATLPVVAGPPPVVQPIHPVQIVAVPPAQPPPAPPPVPIQPPALPPVGGTTFSIGGGGPGGGPGTTYSITAVGPGPDGPGQPTETFTPAPCPPCPPPPPPVPTCPPPIVICPDPAGSGNGTGDGGDGACQLTRPCAPLDVTLQDAAAWAAGIDKREYRSLYAKWLGVDLSEIMDRPLDTWRDELEGLYDSGFGGVYPWQ